jgi:hypothetical protein
MRPRQSWRCNTARDLSVDRCQVVIFDKSPGAASRPIYILNWQVAAAAHYFTSRFISRAKSRVGSGPSRGGRGSSLVRSPRVRGRRRRTPDHQWGSVTVMAWASCLAPSVLRAAIEVSCQATGTRWSPLWVTATATARPAPHGPDLDGRCRRLGPRPAEIAGHGSPVHHRCRGGAERLPQCRMRRRGPKNGPNAVRKSVGTAGFEPATP